MGRPLAIEVHDLGKRYRLGQTESYRTLRESVRWAAGLPWRLLHRKPSASKDSGNVLWALRKISFEVAEGEVVGIIGRNGAGKSTLLKLLSRITKPTEGRALLRGRVGSLLEVGTGFHPELTGRENIFLNGSILGMRHAEIMANFDQIVDFSGIEAFLDTPVKRYSSGMRIRLAFSVAAHLEPEILVVDEVLAVGDAEFQRKCLGKMDSVARGGRTVLFVSHNMAAIQSLCRRGIWLEGGRIAFQGEMNDTIDAYLAGTAKIESGFADLREHRGRKPGAPVLLESVGIVDPASSPASPPKERYRRVVTTGEDITFEIAYDTGERTLDYAFLAVCTPLGERVLSVATHHDPHFQETFRGKGCLRCRLPEVALNEGEYSVLVALGTQRPNRNVDCVQDAMQFRVELHDYFGTGASLLSGQGRMVQRSFWRCGSQPSDSA